MAVYLFTSISLNITVNLLKFGQFHKSTCCYEVSKMGLLCGKQYLPRSTLFARSNTYNIECFFFF